METDNPQDTRWPPLPVEEEPSASRIKVALGTRTAFVLDFLAVAALCVGLYLGLYYGFFGDRRSDIQNYLCGLALILAGGALYLARRDRTAAGDIVAVVSLVVLGVSLLVLLWRLFL